MSGDAPKPKPLKPCVYCKKDAFWTVAYDRYLHGRDDPLKVRDLACDAHLATACGRASARLRVRPRFLVGPGGSRIMPNGLKRAAEPDRLVEAVREALTYKSGGVILSDGCNILLDAIKAEGVDLKPYRTTSELSGESSPPPQAGRSAAAPS